jgi:dipeptidyl aminopeptidase
VLAVNEKLSLAYVSSRPGPPSNAMLIDRLVHACSYVLAAAPSTERHVYSAALPAKGADTKALADWVPTTEVLTSDDKPSYFGARFSPGAGFWVESYEGPGVPSQRVRSAPGSDGAPAFVPTAAFHSAYWPHRPRSGEVDLVLEDNAELAALVADYLLPTAQWTTATVDDIVLNVKEIRPPNMDESGKTRYPLLLAPYGGPNSQSVHTRFGLGFNEHLAAELGYIILVVDGRGTGFRGKLVRNPIRGQLGAMEARDQIEVARLWAGKRAYVDSKRVGIWGWSFGGYLTGKVLELGGQPGSEGVISLGMSVAPVTDWRFVSLSLPRRRVPSPAADPLCPGSSSFYDSIYTERYMLTPEANLDGYAASGINNMTGFHAADFLLAQLVPRATRGLPLARPRLTALPHLCQWLGRRQRPLEQCCQPAREADDGQGQTLYVARLHRLEPQVRFSCPWPRSAVCTPTDARVWAGHRLLPQGLDRRSAA